MTNKFNSETLTPKTYFIKTIRGVKRVGIYYEPDIFNENIVLSASLLIGADETPFRTHYNTIHDEVLVEPIEDIAIPIYKKPESVMINGLKNVDIGKSYHYEILDYDLSNSYTYDWYVEGLAYFVSNNTQSSLNAGKGVDIFFQDIDTITIKLKITNMAGCYRWIIKNVYPGTLNKKIMVVRYPYF